ncbi:hypothetical protein [Corynebacterium matruchotii]|uniref:hypothetical protein n=1 Tax=Corynebacterium matruchotii TaxID=43768 RepID=UPI0028E87991|nr:hypothetical protein [Corynebacterium matruchotii]
MDDYLLHELGKALYTLETEGGALADLLTFRRGSGGDTPGGRSACTSRPPVNLSMLDLKICTENLLTFWAGQIAAASGCSALQEHSVPVLAGWLQQQLWVFDEAPWGGMAAEEIVAQARLVAEVVADSSVGEGEEAPPEWASCRVVASWLARRGYRVSHMRVWRWAQAGRVRTATGDGGTLVCYADAERACIDAATDAGVAVLHPMV